MPGNSFLLSLFRRHLPRLSLTYMLFAIEMIGDILRPFFLGIAINDLLTNSYAGLIYLIIQHTVWLLASTIRRMYDTRTYSSIYNDLVFKLLKNNSADISKLAAHTTLTQEFTTFLEFDFTSMVQSFFNLLGSLFLLYYYKPSLVGICIALLIPSGIVNYVYARKIAILNKGKNDEIEKQVDILATRNSSSFTDHFTKLKKWNIKISDLGAWTFGITEVFVIGVITLSLTGINDGKHLPAGDILGIYNYVLRFIAGADMIPYMVQRFSLLKDLTRRIDYDMKTESVQQEVII